MKNLYCRILSIFLDKTLIIIVLFFASFTSSAQQHRIKFGTQAPISHFIGYEYEFKNRMTVGMEVGLLTSPYGELFNSMMRNWGMEERMRKLLNDTFTYGWVFQPSVGYTINSKYHIDVFGQHFYSSTTAPPVNSFVEFFGTGIDPAILDQLPLNTDLRIVGKLYHVGALVERRIPFKNPKWELRVGLGFSSNIRTRNIIEIKQTGSVQIAQETLDLITDQTNQEIRDNYLKYAHIPMISLKFVHHLGKETAQE
ncbi:MAG: hypothetical protein ACPGJS_00205 [Flammeovirgaceae bacterium]